MFSSQPTVSVTANPLTKTYDATATFATPTFTATGLVDASLYGGVFTQDALTGSLAVGSPSKNVGTYPIVQGTLAAPAGYLFSSYAGNIATVTPASLTVSGLSANDKVYDATTAATLSGAATLGGVLAGDVVSVSGGTGNFADKNVGTGKAVTVSGITLSGADVGNYVVAAPTGLTANITPASLTGERHRGEQQGLRRHDCGHPERHSHCHGAGLGRR